MKGKKTVGVILLVLGIIVLILSLSADLIGAGAAPGFGYRQIIGAVVGIIAAIVGLFMMRKK